ncbi:hypothetical protein [Nostoc sp. CCY0012]|uniref:hypothetical protein n=1 Tax=Nostoc sp. CCY0012 TaxID=1056123 RepID=UPI0039C67C17
MVQTELQLFVPDKPKSKRQDPNFTKITADVSRDNAAKVRAISALCDISFSEAVDEALADWIEKKKADKKFEI